MSGNIRQTEDVLNTPENLEKIEDTWFEKRVSTEKKSKKEKVVAEEITEEITETEEVQEENTTEEVEDDSAERALLFLKEKKIRGCHLLKGAKLMEKAIAEGFII